MLHRYLLRQLGSLLLITAPAICIFVALLQAMRLLPLVSASGIGAADALYVVLLLLVPLSAVALPAATVIAILVVLARLQADGELLALRACGVSSHRIAVAPATLCVVVALAASGLAVFVEPIAYRDLQGRMGELLLRSALGRIRPATLVEPVPELTVLARRRVGNQLEGLFLEDRRRAPAQLFAAKATIAPLAERPGLRLVLEDGVLHSRDEGRWVRARFSRLQTTLRLDGAVGELAAIVPTRFGQDPWTLLRHAQADGGVEARAASLLLHRRLAVGPGALGLCLLTLMLALWKPMAGRPWAITGGAVLILLFHLLSRVGEALVEAGSLTPALGGWLATGACWILLLGPQLLRPLFLMCFRISAPRSG